MNKADLARNMAQSLTLGAWSKEWLGTVLLRRFPASLHRFATGISSELIIALPGSFAPDITTVAKALQASAEFGQVFQYCHKHNIWPDPDLALPVMAPVAVFEHLGIPQIASLGALADWLLLPIGRLEYLADLHARYEENGETAINHYHYVLKRKKSKGQRVIEAPKQTLKSCQK